MRDTAREQLNAATNLAVSSTDPASAVANMSRVAALLSMAAPEWRDTARPSRIITPSTTIAVAVSAVAATPTALIPVYFPNQGRVVGIIGTCAEGDDVRAQCTMSILMDGGTYLFSTGKNEAYVPLSFLSGFRSRDLSYLPVDKRVDANTQWQVRFSSSTLLAVAANRTALIGFLYEEDLDMLNR